MTRLLLDHENPWITGLRYVAEDPYFIVYRNRDGSEGWILYDDASPDLQLRARQAHESAETAEREAAGCRWRIVDGSWTMGNGNRGVRWEKVS